MVMTSNIWILREREQFFMITGWLNVSVVDEVVDLTKEEDGSSSKGLV